MAFLLLQPRTHLIFAVTGITIESLWPGGNQPEWSCSAGRQAGKQNPQELNHTRLLHFPNARMKHVPPLLMRSRMSNAGHQEPALGQVLPRGRVEPGKGEALPNSDHWHPGRCSLIRQIRSTRHLLVPCCTSHGLWTKSLVPEARAPLSEFHGSVAKWFWVPVIILILSHWLWKEI